MKVTLNRLTSGYGSQTLLNTNLDSIEAGFENTLSRDGSTPNTMEADLDMNGYRILNALASGGEGFVWKGAWVTSTAYEVNNLASNSGNTYICVEDHTSGVFATDLAAVKWEVFASKGSSGAGTGDMLAANNLSDLANKSTSRTNLGVAIGVNVQAYDANTIAVAPGASGNVLTSNGSAWTSAAPAVTSTFSTGMVIDYVGTTAPSGWVLLSGRTIGNATSGATERANADTETLYTLLWNSMANSEAVVSTGRGASAAADFAANKTITLPDARGRVIAGKDDMGGSAASRLTNVGAGIVGTTLGTAGGAQTHTLSAAESGLQSHSHNTRWPSGQSGGASLINTVPDNTTPGAVILANTTSQTPPTTPVTLYSAYDTAASSSAAGSAHNNTQPSLVLNKIVKL